MMIHPEQKPAAVQPGEIADKVRENLSGFNSEDRTPADFLQQVLMQQSPGLVDELGRYGSGLHGFIVSANTPSGDTHSNEGAIEGALYGLEVSKHLIAHPDWQEIMKEKFRQKREVMAELSREAASIGAETRYFSNFLAKESLDRYMELPNEYRALIEELAQRHPRQAETVSTSVFIGFGYTVALGHDAMHVMAASRGKALLAQDNLTIADLGW